MKKEHLYSGLVYVWGPPQNDKESGWYEVVVRFMLRYPNEVEAATSMEALLTRVYGARGLESGNPKTPVEVFSIELFLEFANQISSNSELVEKILGLGGLRVIIESVLDRYDVSCLNYTYLVKRILEQINHSKFDRTDFAPYILDQILGQVFAEA